MLLTGDLIDGTTAAKINLVTHAVPAAHLDATVAALAERMASVPKNQLAMQKLTVNSAFEMMGLVRLLLPSLPLPCLSLRLTVPRVVPLASDSATRHFLRRRVATFA